MNSIQKKLSRSVPLIQSYPKRTDQIQKQKGRQIYWCWFKEFSHLNNIKIHPNMDDFQSLEIDSLLHAFPSLKLITFHQTRVIGVYNECKKYVVNIMIIMVFPSAKLVFRFRLSFNQILSPGLQLTPGFSTLRDMLDIFICWTLQRFK